MGRSVGSMDEMDVVGTSSSYSSAPRPVRFELSIETDGVYKGL